MERERENYLARYDLSFYRVLNGMNLLSSLGSLNSKFNN